MDSLTKALMTEFVKVNNLESLSESDQFEHFAAFSVVSSRHSDEFRSDDLVVGGSNDLSVDAFAVKVNGRIVQDEDEVTDLLDTNGYLEAEFVIVQAKTSSKFNGKEITTLGANLADQIFAENQTVPMSDDVKRLIAIKERIFINGSSLKSRPTCRIYYVTTGNWKNDKTLVGMIAKRKEALHNTNLFDVVHFEPVGARELQNMYQATKTSISREVQFDKLVTLPSIKNVKASYLGVLPVDEYLKLIKDNDDEILKSVFVDNVRDFQGMNPVNTDIAQTIHDRLFDQFVLRNNGVTIVARNIRVMSNKYTLEDYQVVNGCQTSHVIFKNRNVIDGDLLVPIKLIHTESDDVAQSIVKSTNKQTKVEDNDLLSLTQFQRDLEAYFSGFQGDLKLYYERRAKQYANSVDIEKGRIISPKNQLKSFASMFLDFAHRASRYHGTLMKDVGDRVFRPKHRFEAYYTAAFAYYRFEVSIRKLPEDDKTMRSFRFFLLQSFRYRYEPSKWPEADNKRVVNYCEVLNLFLNDIGAFETVFDECLRIVKEAVRSVGLELVRDSAKSIRLVEEVKIVARKRKESADHVVCSGRGQANDGSPSPAEPGL